MATFTIWTLPQFEWYKKHLYEIVDPNHAIFLFFLLVR